MGFEPTTACATGLRVRHLDRTRLQARLAVPLIAATSRTSFRFTGQVRFELTMSSDGGLKARCVGRATLLAPMRSTRVELVLPAWHADVLPLTLRAHDVAMPRFRGVAMSRFRRIVIPFMDAPEGSRTPSLCLRRAVRSPVTLRARSAPGRSRTCTSGIRSSGSSPVGPLVHALEGTRTLTEQLRKLSSCPVRLRAQIMGTLGIEPRLRSPRPRVLPSTPRPRRSGPFWLTLVGSLGSGPCSSICTFALYDMTGKTGFEPAPNTVTGCHRCRFDYLPLMGTRGVEPRLTASKAAVLPLHHVPKRHQ